MNVEAREFDIVLFGATGFVGRLTARHLAAEADPRVRIALAGRSLTRLREVAADLGPAAPRAGRCSWSTPPTSRRSPTWPRRAAVVVTTVGPYVKYGVPAGGRVRRGRHPLLRPHRRGAVRAPQHRREPRDRPAHRRPHRPRLRLRLDPQRPRGVADGAGGPRRRRRARPHPPGRAQHEGRLQRRHHRLRPHPGRGAQGRQGRPPRRRRPVGARGGGAPAAPAATARHPARSAHEGRPGRAARHGDQGVTGEAGCRQRPLHRAVRHGRVQHPHRRALGVPAGLRRRVPLRRVLRLRSRAGRRRDRRVASVALGAGLAGFAFGPTRALLDRVLPKPGRGAEPGGPGQGPVPDGGHRAGDQRRPLPDHGGRSLRPRLQGNRVHARARRRSASSRTATSCRMPRACSPPRPRWVPRSSTGCGRTASRSRPSAFPADGRGDPLGVDAQLAQHPRDRVGEAGEPQAGCA